MPIRTFIFIFQFHDRVRVKSIKGKTQVVAADRLKERYGIDIEVIEVYEDGSDITPEKKVDSFIFTGI